MSVTYPTDYVNVYFQNHDKNALNLPFAIMLLGSSYNRCWNIGTVVCFDSNAGAVSVPNHCNGVQV